MYAEKIKKKNRFSFRFQGGSPERYATDEVRTEILVSNFGYAPLRATAFNIVYNTQILATLGASFPKLEIAMPFRNLIKV